MTKLANRTHNLTSFKVVDFLEAAQSLEAQGRDIIHMEIGEPRFETAAPILEAARMAMTEGRTGYTPSCGIPELRQAIADFDKLVLAPGARAAGRAGGRRRPAARPHGPRTRSAHSPELSLPGPRLMRRAGCPLVPL